MAGESASEQAQRLREKAARLERSAQMWERGARGEATTAAAIEELRARGWATFHDVRWPGRPRANIDHIVVGPNGVFVIDSKNWSGDVRVVDDVLYQAGRRREREVAAAAEAGLAITQLLDGFPATPVLCFVRDAPLEGWARDVMVCSPQTLAARLIAAPAVLGPDSGSRVIDILRWHLQSATHTRSPAPVLPRPVRSSRARARPVGAGMGRRLTRGLLGLALLIVGSVVGLSLVGSGLEALMSPAPSGGSGKTAASAANESSPVLGDAVHLPGTQSHPPVVLKADKLMRLASTSPDYPLQRGKHLVGVRYSIRNLGHELWGATYPYLQFSALASNGQHAQHGSYSTLDQRKLMPAAFNLRRGKAQRGYVVFAVPNGSKLVRVSAEFNFGSGDRAEWLLP